MTNLRCSGKLVMTAYLGVATLCIVWNVKQPVSVAELLKFIITRELGKRRVSYLF